MRFSVLCIEQEPYFHMFEIGNKYLRPEISVHVAYSVLANAAIEFHLTEQLTGVSDECTDRLVYLFTKENLLNS